MNRGHKAAPFPPLLKVIQFLKSFFEIIYIVLLIWYPRYLYIFLASQKTFLKILPYLGLLHNLSVMNPYCPSMSFQFVWLIILICLTIYYLSSLYLITFCTHHVLPLSQALLFIVLWISHFLSSFGAFYPTWTSFLVSLHLPKFYPFFNALTKFYPTSLGQTHLSSSEPPKHLLPI